MSRAGIDSRAQAPAAHAPQALRRLRRDAQLMRLREALDLAHAGTAEQERIAWLERRVAELEAQLAAIEAGGWWRLRGRLLPVIRAGRQLLNSWRQ